MMGFDSDTMAPFYKADRGVQVLSTRPECMHRTRVIPFSKPGFNHNFDSGKVNSGDVLRLGDSSPRLID